MEYAEKIRLLKEYDFSAWREVERGNEETSIALNVLASFAEVTNLADGIKNENSTNFVRACYQNARGYFDRVKWDELDLLDSDFKWLFDFYNTLKEYGDGLDIFLKKYEEGFNCSRNSDEFKKLEEAFEQIKQRNYREEVLMKHGIMFWD